MLFSSLSWVFFTLMLIVALPGALASPSPKRPKKSTSTRVTVETYPAMEDAEIVTPPMEAKTNRRVQTLAGVPTLKFETVPAEKRAQVLQRLQLCQSLFEISGRAYDYRTMTTVELQKELDAVRMAGRDPILDAQE